METKGNILGTFRQQDILSPDIWTKYDNVDEFLMQEDVKEQLIEIANKFIEFVDIVDDTCEVDTRDCDIIDMVVTGSISNYNWSKFSDIDLHIILDFSELGTDEDMVRNFLNTKKNLWNASHDITVRGFEVELYGQDVDETHFSSGVYSILFNEWVIKPSYEKSDIDTKKILSKAKPWMGMIDDLYSKQYERDSSDMLELIDEVKRKLKKFRSCGLDEGGEYSYENLAFKFLRRSGYIKRLFQLKNNIIDLSLSLD
tara:strand:+ start:3955 stop:4722 length:768 start_codon:yes stop_codon:yes gene_type:complete